MKTMKREALISVPMFRANFPLKPHTFYVVTVLKGKASA